MRIIEAKGSFRDIGRATGEALREEIARHVALAKLEGGVEDPTQRRRLATYVAVLASETPELHEELKATAEGADQPFDTLAAINLPLSYSGELDACTNAVFATGPDGPVWGKNNDGKWAERERQLPVCCRKLAPDRGIPTVTFTFAGWVGFGDGMNAEGLAMGHSSVGSRFQQSDRHVQIRLWSHWGLLTCRTTREFIGHMTSRPMRGKGYASVVTDRQGDSVSLEAPCPLVQVRRGDHPDGHVHCVNLYQLPPLREADRRKPAMKELALRRWRMMDEQLAAEGPHDLARMKSLLRYHGEPGVCRHGGGDVSHTEYSMIGLPAQGRVLFHHGYPCEGEYTKTSVC